MSTRARYSFLAAIAALAAIAVARCTQLLGLVDTKPKTGESTLVAAPSGLTAVASTNGASLLVKLSWTPSPTSGATYNVYRGISAGDESAAPIGTSSSQVYTDSDQALADDTTYYYMVKADSAGVESAASNEASTTTAAAGSVTVTLQ